MSAFPIHPSSEHAAGPGADPESGHREGQLTNRSCAQVSYTDRPSHNTYSLCGIQIEEEKRGIISPLTPPVLLQVVLFGRSHCVLSCGAGDRPLLRCRGNREVQETSVRGAADF